MPRASFLSLPMLLAAIASTASARAEDTPPTPRQPPPYQLEVGPSLAWIKHIANTSTSTSYGAGLSYTGLFFRVTPAPWLKVSARFQRSYHDVLIEPGSLGAGAQVLSVDQAKVDALYGFIHPTWSPIDRLHLWLTAGIGWGHIDVPQIKIDPAQNGPVERSRAGVFVETPFGLGGSFDVIPRWLSVSYDAMYAPAFSQSGDVFTSDSYLDRNGQTSTIGGLPKLSGSFYQFISLALTL